MYLVEVMVREKLLNILLVLLSLVQAGISVANTQQTSTNVTVFRTPGRQDSFAFTSTDHVDCSLSTQKICTKHGGTQGNINCKTKDLCCNQCTCEKRKPTYVVHKQRCSEDKNITKNLKYNTGDTFYLLSSTISQSCTSQALLTIDTQVPGKRNFAMCSSDTLVDKSEVTECSLVPSQSRYLNRNGSWAGLHDPITRRAIKHGFTVGKLELKWQGGQNTLQGRIVYLDVKCSKSQFTGRGTISIDVEARLYFKIAGSRVAPGPSISSHVAPSVALSTTSTVVIPTDETVTIATVKYHGTTIAKVKLNRVQVDGKADIVLVIVAAVLGSILFLVLVSVCVAMVYSLKRKQRRNISGKKGTSNPMYERGPDNIMCPQNGEPRQTSLYNTPTHFYQPLVENTREAHGPSGEPIYQSLDNQRRDSKALLTGENPNRCSLAFCDMTTDGYLVPADGHTYPEPPTATISQDNLTEGSNLSSTPPEHQRLSYQYYEPEGIISDEHPVAPRKDSDQESNYDDVIVITQNNDPVKPFYYELEDPNESDKTENPEQTKSDIRSEDCSGGVEISASDANSKMPDYFESPML